MRDHPKFTDPVVSREIDEARAWLDAEHPPGAELEAVSKRFLAERDAMIAKGVPLRAAQTIILTAVVKLIVHSALIHPDPGGFLHDVLNHVLDECEEVLSPPFNIEHAARLQ